MGFIDIIFYNKINAANLIMVELTLQYRGTVINPVKYFELQFLKFTGGCVICVDFSILRYIMNFYQSNFKPSPLKKGCWYGNILYLVKFIKDVTHRYSETIFTFIKLLLFSTSFIGKRNLLLLILNM